MSLTMRTIALPLLALGMSACGGGSAPAPPTPAAPADPAVAALDSAGGAVRADGAVGRHRRAAGGRAQGAGAHDSRRAGDGRAVPASGLGRQRVDADGPAAGPEPDRPGPPALLPDQQGAVVAARSQRSRSCPARPRSRPRPTTTPPARRGPRSSSGWRSLPAPARTAATGFFTTIRRGATGGFIAVPYSVEYQGELALAADPPAGGGRSHHAAHAQGLPARRARRRSSATTTTTAT